jgi:hypothetical protein
MFRNKTLGWWYWCVTVVLLAASLLGWRGASSLLVAFCVFQTAHFIVREGSVQAFPSQLRLAYLGLLLAGILVPIRLILWIQLVGTLAFVTVNYCFLARVLVLMPWNRRVPTSLGVVVRTIFSRPMSGAVLLASAAGAPAVQEAR